MPGLLNSADRNDVISRIQKLSPDAKPLWGRMSVAQMLAHCQAPIMVSLGDVKSKQGLLGMLFGRIAKKKIMAPVPISKNLPTVPGFRVKEDRDFKVEQKKLIQLIERFAGGPAVLTDQPHPFFGKMSKEEWDASQWKHLDHHLTQFGIGSIHPDSRIP